MHSSQTLSKLIGKIYQAATDVTRLRDAVESIANEIGADFATLALGELGANESSSLVITVPDVNDEGVIDYKAFVRPWTVAVLQKESGCLYSHENIQPNFAEVDGTRTWLEKIDFQRGFSTSFPLKKSRFGFLGFCRKNGRSAFDTRHLELIELLVPHIKQAIGINRHLDEIMVLHDVMLERYKKFSVGVILLDENARIVFSNPIAKRLLKEPGGIDVIDGHLSGEQSTETAKLDKLIRSAIQNVPLNGKVSEGLISLTRNQASKSPLSVIVSSYINKLEPRTLSASNGRGLAIIFDPDRPRITHKHILEQLYDLTDAESALAIKLASGKTLTELAADNTISRETLRSQLKRVFQKTQTKRQSELVSLVLGGPGSLVI